MRSLFIAGTSTGVGKTVVSRAIAASCTAMGLNVAALKPVETGVDPEPSDARALARACGRPDLADAAGFYRAAAPLAPMAIKLAGGQAPPSPTELVAAVDRVAGSADLRLIEGCGGLMVPMSENSTMLDLARRLGAPIVVVGANQLGVLSDVLTTVACAREAQLSVAAVVLNEHGPRDTQDRSHDSNAAVLAECLAGVPVVSFPATPDDDAALADAAARSGLLSALKLA